LVFAPLFGHGLIDTSATFQVRGQVSTMITRCTLAGATFDDQVNRAKHAILLLHYAAQHHVGAREQGGSRKELQASQRQVHSDASSQMDYEEEEERQRGEGGEHVWEGKGQGASSAWISHAAQGDSVAPCVRVRSSVISHSERGVCVVGSGGVKASKGGAACETGSSATRPSMVNMTFINTLIQDNVRAFVLQSNCKVSIRSPVSNPSHSYPHLIRL
jgi:hypothetical protein